MAKFNFLKSHIGNLDEGVELINQFYWHGIYEPDTVLAEAQKLAQRVIKAHPQSVKAVKSTVLHSFFMPLQYAFNADAELSSQLFGEPVQLERTKSFLEKRHAEFLPTEGTE